MARILNSAILNLAILDSAILVFHLKVTHTYQDWFPPFAQKNFTHSIWLNLMMAAILNSVMLDWDIAILDSDTLLSSLRYTQKHSHLILTLTQTNSIWLKLIQSHLTWWRQPTWILPSWICPSWIQPSWYFLSKSLPLATIGSQHLHKKIHSFILTQLDDGIHLEFCHVWFRHCHLGFRHLVIFSQIHSKAFTPLWLWLKLIQSDSNSFILTWLDDGRNLKFCHLEFGYVGFSHLSISSQTHSHLPWLVPTIAQKNFHSFSLTQIDDGSHLEFCHVGFRHCHLGFRHLVIFSQIHSKTLSLHSDSDSY